MKSKKTPYISYIWSIVTNLIVLIVVISIFQSIYSGFETVVVSILTLIYVNIISFFNLWSRQKQKEFVAFFYEFKRMRSLIGEKLDDDDERYDKKEEKNAQHELKVQEVKFIINSIFLYLIYIFVILSLISSI